MFNSQNTVSTGDTLPVGYITVTVHRNRYIRNLQIPLSSFSRADLFFIPSADETREKLTQQYLTVTCGLL